MDLRKLVAEITSFEDTFCDCLVLSLQMNYDIAKIWRGFLSACYTCARFVVTSCCEASLQSNSIAATFI